MDISCGRLPANPSQAMPIQPILEGQAQAYGTTNDNVTIQANMAKAVATSSFNREQFRQNHDGNDLHAAADSRVFG